MADLPEEVRDVLTTFAQRGHGVYDPPYVHQADALEAFFGPAQSDLIVTTGTGSGKTEIFSNAILGRTALEGMQPPRLVEEDGEQREVAPSAVDGIRTLVLYPMNALVSDQLTRIRKMFGVTPTEDGHVASTSLQAFRPHTVRSGMPCTRAEPRTTAFTNLTEMTLRFDRSWTGTQTRSRVPLDRNSVNLAGCLRKT